MSNQNIVLQSLEAHNKEIIDATNAGNANGFRTAFELLTQAGYKPTAGKSCPCCSGCIGGKKCPCCNGCIHKQPRKKFPELCCDREPNFTWSDMGIKQGTPIVSCFNHAMGWAINDRDIVVNGKIVPLREETVRLGTPTGRSENSLQTYFRWYWTVGGQRLTRITDPRGKCKRCAAVAQGKKPPERIQRTKWGRNDVKWSKFYTFRDDLIGTGTTLYAWINGILLTCETVGNNMVKRAGRIMTLAEAMKDAYAEFYVKAGPKTIALATVTELKDAWAFWHYSGASVAAHLQQHNRIAQKQGNG